MQSFEALSQKFNQHFTGEHFPLQPQTLYEPNRYFLSMGGKRVRPVACLMANELFDAIHADTWHVANAIELFHNFTLIHDDIMDNAPLRRNRETLHQKFGSSTALLAGDVMLVTAYDYLNKISGNYLRRVVQLFNKTAKEVCEGQQLDMDYEKMSEVPFDNYLHMINLKTSVLLAGSLQMGGIMGGASERNQHLLYEFGRKLGLAFQIQDDYLDAFGNPEKFGKQKGGDIKANKKTFLLIHALQTASEAQKEELQQLLQNDATDKVEGVLSIFKTCGVDQWAQELKDKYIEEAYIHLEDIAVLSKRKEPLKQLALFLTQREH